MKGYEKPVIKTGNGEEQVYNVSENKKSGEVKCPKKCNMYSTDWNCSGMCEYYIEKKGWSFLGAKCGLRLNEDKAS